MNNSIVKLKNVSKFYYNKGIIASGFVKLNLELKIGEFVAITGESGSGKSTLLNVISGLDSYEEGEMYINGVETSHYTEQDLEEYRRTYISNIFQNFNLVNSYTVYQNIELVMLLNGSKKKDIKKKALELIKIVGLEKFKNTKASKLSGGQKQRVSIARALAKDTPIIIADEPTGNLDSKSAKEIIKLLHKISKDKLVIIVTHNYDQVEEYVTRKIKMHDGKILEDRLLKEYTQSEKIENNNYKNIRFLSKIQLGIRNSINVKPKFLLALAVYLFITVALMAEYSSFKEQEYIQNKSGYNYLFKNTEDTRIVIKKKNHESISENEYNEILKLDNVDYIIKNDLLLDTTVNLSDENYWITSTVNSINNFKSKLDYGKMPENDNEIIISGSKDDYYISYLKDEIINKELYLTDIYTEEPDKTMPLKIVGINYTDTDSSYYKENEIYVSDNILKNLTYQINQQYSTIKVLFQDKYYNSDKYENNFKVVPKKNIKEGTAYISSELNYLCKNENCIGKELSIELENIYYKENLNLKVEKTYTKKNIEFLLNIKDYDSIKGNIFISTDDYNNLFNKGNYQSSIFVKDPSKIDDTIELLNKKGYHTLKIKDTLVQEGILEVLKIMKTIVTIILVVVLFFISYFVIRIILKSRNTYFATIRMLGANKKISKQLLIIELLNVANIAYILFLLIIYLNKIKLISINFINTIIKYLLLKDYITIYIILILISFIVSLKFSKKLFKNSAMKTLKEEV